jgi:hypothetical protein
MFSRRWLWRMVSSGMLRRVALVRTDVSEELSASFIRVTQSVYRFLSPWWRRLYVLPKHCFLQEPHGVTSQKAPFSNSLNCFQILLDTQVLGNLRFSRRWLWRMVSSGLLRRVALVITDVSDEPGVSFIRVTKICELGTTLAATSNRRTLRTSVARSRYQH